MTDPTQPGESSEPPLVGLPPPGPAYPGPPPPGYAYPPTPPAGYAYPDLKSRQTAGLLGIFLGGVGVHRFYLGYTSMGVLQILVTIATCGFGGFWGITEGVLILSGKGITTDADGKPLRP